MFDYIFLQKDLILIFKLKYLLRIKFAKLKVIRTSDLKKKYWYKMTKTIVPKQQEPLSLIDI